MPRRAVSVALPVAVVLGLLGARVGAVLGAIPPTPTVSLPTVTVPPLPPAPVPVPLPAPPPPPVAVPPKVEASPVPATPPPPELPAPTSVPTVDSSSVSPLPELRGGGSSSRYYARKLAAERARKGRAASVRAANRPAASKAVASDARAPQVRGVSASVQGPVPEDSGFLAPISAALNSFEDAATAIPGALFAMALLAVFLLTLASVPLPLRTTRASAMLVHKRGSIAAAGVASLGMAIATYLLL